MNSRKFGALIVSIAALAGCYAGETFDTVEMRRSSDGAVAGCGSGTYGVSIFGQDNKAPLNVTRCVVACEKLGFVVGKSFPRPDMIIAREQVKDVTEKECAIRPIS